MKLLPALRFHGFIYAGTLILVLSLGTISPIFSAPATNIPSGTPPPPPVEVDKETGKPIVTTPTGLKYVDLVVGKGAAVKTGDHVTVNYVGKLVDGTKFDASADHGGTFDYVQGVDHLIAGWTEGTSTMNIGGKRKLIIPPQLGYGLQGAGDAIPPNSTLIFEIEVISVNNPK